MVKLRITLQDFEKECFAFLDCCADLNVFVRSVELQRKKCAEIDSLVEKVLNYKYGAIHDKNEIAANRLFHIQCLLLAIKSSLTVWIKLKENNPHDAWECLIDAQEYKDVALLTRDYDGIRGFETRLNEMRSTLFPHFNLYNSPGWVETIGKCSICGSSFSLCSHVENRVYMGRLCRRVDREVLEMSHSALVENPRDRRCVISKRSEGDRMIDNFTLEDVGARRREGNAIVVEGILFSAKGIDLD